MFKKIKNTSGNDVYKYIFKCKKIGKKEYIVNC